MADRQYHLKFDGSRAADVDAYLEYRRIVGDDDGGVMFTPEQYEAYKKEVLPQRMRNRLFTSWTNSAGMDCKLIGPETPCFCQHRKTVSRQRFVYACVTEFMCELADCKRYRIIHDVSGFIASKRPDDVLKLKPSKACRYKQHRTDFAVIPTERPILQRCEVKGCQCSSYHYVPLVGSSPIRCSCKHLADEHSEARPFQCKKGVCQKCSGFKSSYTCGCGDTYTQHRMVVETKEEREARGHPVGVDTPYKAMGGLTGFSSLAEGYMRLDPSGRGAPSDEFLGQEITSQDHAFLRAAVPSVQAQRRANKDYDKLDEDMAERMSAMRRPGESELDYYERRYQERLKAERANKRGVAPSQVRSAPRKPSDKPGPGPRK